MGFRAPGASGASTATATANGASAQASTVGCCSRAARDAALPILGWRTTAAASAPALAAACLPALHRTTILLHRTAVVLGRATVTLHGAAASPGR